MKKFLIIITLALFSFLVNASERPPWFNNAIKSKTPNQLPYYIGVSKDCPIKLTRAESVVEGVLIRSRVKPLKGDIYAAGIVYLNIYVSCVPLESNNPVFNIEVNFGRINPKPAIIFDQSFGNSGIGDQDFIMQVLKERVESAMTAYIKANFDL